MAEYNFVFSSNDEYLIIHNRSGHIILYRWCVDSQVTIHNEPCTLKHFVDNFGSVALSLEQQKQIEVENCRKAKIEAKKMKINETFTNLKTEFKALKQRNDELPNEFRLPDDFFEIDGRITADMERKAQIEMENLQNEMFKKINRLKQHAEHIEKAYMSNIEHWPTVLTGFRYFR